MRLKVPFFKQTSKLNCGPSALRMVLAYLGKDEGIEILEAKTGIKEGKGISTIKIAIAAASLEYKTEFYSKHILFDEEHLNLDFYKKYGDIDLAQSTKLVENAKAAGVNIQEKTLSLKELLEVVTKNTVPIVLIDWNIITNKKEKGYQGHFVPIVGYNKQHVYIHNHGLNDTQEFMPIKREIFNEARKVEGTDEDVVVVYRK